jgi:hypothetical protein
LARPAAGGCHNGTEQQKPGDRSAPGGTPSFPADVPPPAFFLYKFVVTAKIAARRGLRRAWRSTVVTRKLEIARTKFRLQRTNDDGEVEYVERHQALATLAFPQPTKAGRTLITRMDLVLGTVQYFSHFSPWQPREQPAGG